MTPKQEYYKVAAETILKTLSSAAMRDATVKPAKKQSKKLFLM